MMTTGAICIGEFLKQDHTLKGLVMVDNPDIDDRGISQFMKLLQLNTALTALHVDGCKFEGTVAKCNSCDTGGSV